MAVKKRKARKSKGKRKSRKGTKRVAKRRVAKRKGKRTRKAKAKKGGKRPLKVLQHFYRKTQRKQAQLASLIKKRGGAV